MADRKSLLAKIKALLAKTVDNGCTEAEAFSAFDKAREMMDAYDVSEADLAFDGETVEKLKTRKSASDGIRNRLAPAIATFCACMVWRGESEDLVFFGLQSDVIFASWLLDTLERFVQRHLMRHMAEVGSFNVKIRAKQRDGFVSGCVNRISERLIEAARARSNGRGLVVSKQALVKAAFDKLGAKLTGGHTIGRRVDSASYDAGSAAGRGATWDRPVNQNEGLHLS